MGTQYAYTILHMDMGMVSVMDIYTHGYKVLDTVSFCFFPKAGLRSIISNQVAISVCGGSKHENVFGFKTYILERRRRTEEDGIALMLVWERYPSAAIVVLFQLGIINDLVFSLIRRRRAPKDADWINRLKIDPSETE